MFSFGRIIIPYKMQLTIGSKFPDSSKHLKREKYLILHVNIVLADNDLLVLM